MGKQLQGSDYPLVCFEVHLQPCCFAKMRQSLDVVRPCECMKCWQSVCLWRIKGHHTDGYMSV